MKFTYLVVFVRDIRATLGLYRDLLEFEVAFEYSEEDGTEVAFVVEPGKVPMRDAAMLEFVAPPGHESNAQGFAIGVEVGSLPDKVRLLQENGYQVTDPYSPAPGYVNADFQGPDGETVSLMQVDVSVAQFHRQVAV